MKKYLVEVTNTPTQINHYTDAYVQKWIYGKADHCLTSWEYIHVGDVSKINTKELLEYGYNSETLAKRCYSYKSRNDQTSEFWTKSARVIEVEVA